jgi:hypothetical protein
MKFLFNAISDQYLLPLLFESAKVLLSTMPEVKHFDTMRNSGTVSRENLVNNLTEIYNKLLPTLK